MKQNDGHHILIRHVKSKDVIDVFRLPNLCGAGGDASFAPRANLVLPL